MLALDRPWWLLLLPPLVVAVLWIGRKTLSGNSTTTRRVALGVRLAVISLIVLALCDPHWRRVSRDVAVTMVLDTSRSVQGGNILSLAGDYVRRAMAEARATDYYGLVTAGRDGRVQSLARQIGQRQVDPTKPGGQVDVSDLGDTEATNLESGVRIAIAATPRNAANRLLLVSDGNETMGSLMAAARSAQAAGIPIDVVPIQYKVDREVIADRLIAPTTAREGETTLLRVVLTSTAPATGRLNLTMNGEALDLDPASPSLGLAVTLAQGSNVIPVPVKLPGRGSVRFEAVFEPGDGSGGRPADTIIQNNRAAAVTFVGGEGRVLALAANDAEAGPFLAAMRDARIRTEVRTPDRAPTSLAELAAYECVVMLNVSAFDLSQKQQEDLRSYVHDLGGGLIMSGGNQGFGAGGWIGSPLAEALPIRLDPPVKRQMPRGALMLIMHSCEMPEGNFWGRRTGEAAIDALSSRDLVGIVEFSWNGGDGLVLPLSEVGNRSAARRAINSLTYGDAPDFDSMMQTSLAQLQGASAGQKHVIIISDGDPSPPSPATINGYRNAGVTVSTVAVFPHGGAGDLARMKQIADDTGGNYHEITRGSQLNTLPQIFIKEAQVVKRTLIAEGDVQPAITNALTETMRGIRSVPSISGYVVSAEREGGLAQVLLRVGQENDPLLAVWQHGLGRVVAYTSDASTRWSSAWVGWAQFRQFWEQHVRWAMRPSGSPNVRVVTTDRGGQTSVVVEALDEAGERMNFLRWQGAAVGPDGLSQRITMRQVGPGRYEGVIDSSEAGAYTIQLGYEQTAADGRVTRGSVQASVTRPFADEFRSLQSNTAPLEQAAKMTGGRVLPADDPVKAELWSRDGLTMPSTRRSIWLIVALGAVGLFLVDVAVRRVRIDLRAMVRAVRRGFGSAKAKGGGQIDALRAARERAQAQIQQRARDSAGAGGAGAASAKFEATAEELKDARAGLSLDQPRETAPIETKSAKPADAAAGEEGMSRLLKAKKRAQGDMKE